MTTLFVTLRDGSQRTLEGREDLSLMEVIRDNGIDELIALCGGCCSCATCHVYVDAQDVALLKPATDDESDLLDSSDQRRATSRLSCQIRLADIAGELHVTIAPED